MALYHSSIHGNSFLPAKMADGYIELVDGEHYTDVVGKPTGTGKKFQLGNRWETKYFHAPIALLGYIADHRPHMDKLYLFFSTSGGDAGVASVELFDARGRLWRWSPGADPNAGYLTGDWSNPRTERSGQSGRLTLTNVYSIRNAQGGPIELYSSVNLVIAVEGTSDNPRGGGAVAQITFHGAGVDLVI